MAKTQTLTRNKQRGTKPSLFEGTFTRSKSLMYAHRTRSGHRFRHGSPSNNKRKAITMNTMSVSDFPASSIRDLRSRRIFSPHDTTCLDGDLVKETVDDKITCSSSTCPKIEICVSHESLIRKEAHKSSVGKKFIRPFSRVRLFKFPDSNRYRRLLASTTGLAGENLSASLEMPMAENVTVTEMALDAHNITRKRLDSSALLVDESSKMSLVNVENGRLEIRCNLANGNMNASSLERCSSFDDSLIAQLSHGKEAKGADVELSCDQVIDSPQKVFPLTTEKNLLEEEFRVSGQSRDNVQCSYKDPHPGLSHNTLGTEGNGTPSTSVMIGGDSEKESIQVPMPDADIAGKVMTYKAVDDMRKVTSKNADQTVMKKQNVNTNVNDTRVVSASEIKLGSRSKIIKPSGSLSYRRLLPFLMDIQEDITQAPEKSDCPNINSQQMSIGESKIECCLVNVSEGNQTTEIGVPLKDENSADPLPDGPPNVKDSYSSGCSWEERANTVGIEGSTNTPVDSAKETVNTVHAMDEESVQMTPPDTEIVGKLISYEATDEQTELIAKSADQVVQPINGSIFRSSCRINDKKANPTNKPKMGLSPCSRSKLYKTPSSFSYRRLLPYLMDTNEDEKGASADSNCSTPEQGFKENLVSPFTLPDQHENSTEIFSGTSHQVKQTIGTSDCLQMNVLMSTGHEPNGNQPNLKSPECTTEDSSPVCSHVETELAVETRESEAAAALLSSVPGGNPSSVPVKDGKLLQNSPLLEVFDVSGHPAPDLKKGILKRNPRGCRGICTCLNCASFRLHAERAFEFSRNQMQDTEEVAQELIKELNHLRNMVEKSAFQSGSGHHDCISQLQEACRKASEAEELAKMHLNQMKYDLSIHCRIPYQERPRVRFSNKVDEKIAALPHKPNEA